MPFYYFVTKLPIDRVILVDFRNRIFQRKKSTDTIVLSYPSEENEYLRTSY